MNDDLFIVNTRHTAVPDWIALRVDIPIQARNLAHVILIKARGPLLPTRVDLAELLGVDTRTIDGWLAQLRSAGVLRTMPAGRRLIFTLIDSDSQVTPDPYDQRSHGSLIHGIADRGDQVLAEKPVQLLEQHDAVNRPISTESIADPVHGGGGGSDSLLKHDPPTPHRTGRRRIRPDDITTATGRWLVIEAGISLAKAYKFQNLPIDAVMADYSRRRELGQGNGAIVLAWEVEPPTAAPAGAPLDTGQYWEGRRAELTAKYGDLFKFGDDLSGMELPAPADLASSIEAESEIAQ